MAVDGSVSVLHIDDDPSIGEEIRELLALRKIDCRTATDIREARKILSSDPFRRIVVIDFRMPGITGAEAIELLQSEHNEVLQFIVLTGDDSQTAAIESLRVRAFDFLRKPIDARALVQGINRAYENLNRDPNEDRFKIKTRDFFGALPDLSHQLQRRAGVLQQVVDSSGSQDVIGACSRAAHATLQYLLERIQDRRVIIDRGQTLADMPELERVIDEARVIIDAVDSTTSAGEKAVAGWLALGRVDVANLIERLSEIVAKASSGKNIHLEVQSQDGLVLARADEARLGRALNEVVSIFAQLLDEDHSVLITAAKDGDEVVLTSLANPAIADASALTVLTQDEFRRRDASHEPGTTMLRLAVAKLIISLHGGRFSLVTGAHQTRMELRLPAGPFHFGGSAGRVGIVAA